MEYEKLDRALMTMLEENDKYFNEELRELENDTFIHDTEPLPEITSDDLNDYLW